MSEIVQFKRNYLPDITYTDIMLIFGELFLTLTPNIKEQILLSCPHTFLIKKNCTGEKLLKYQGNSPWVIISLLRILMTSGVE